MKPETPECKMFGIPNWHHHHSSKLGIVDGDTDPSLTNRLRLKSSAVDIVISPETHGCWLVTYEIRHTAGSYTKGCVWMSRIDLRTAFGLSSQRENSASGWGQIIIDRFGGRVAIQGRYIRFGNYLNIPGPGTGQDGDPNVSICLDDKIKHAVAQLLL